MKYLPITLLVFLLACSGVKKQNNAIELSNEAYDQFDLKRSRKILETALSTDTLEDQEKCKAFTKLAHQDWKYYQQYDLAIARLEKADSICDSRHDVWMLTSRIERESKHFEKAINAASKAQEFAKSENEENSAKMEYAHAVYAFSENQINTNKSIDPDTLIEASQLLSVVLETDAGMPLPSKLLLGISLLNNDGERVLEAWQSYFQIEDIKHTYPYLAGSAEKLHRITKSWRGNVLTTDDQQTLIDALSSSRFYEVVPAYVKRNNNESAYNQKTKDIITYSYYLKEVETQTNEYYRLIAIGQANEETYIEWLTRKRKELWNNLSFTANKTYNENDFLKQTEKHFGARGFTGSTGNYSGFVLALGHIVNQERAEVEQYGYKPEFIYTQLDMMASNGFSSWFWEYKGIGGWATDEEIIRVREVYLNDPMNAWKMITDSIERQETEKIIHDFLNNTSKDQLELSKGLAAKLKFKALIDLYDALSAQGLSGKDLKLAFLSKYDQYRIEASMLAHEGRHSIDQKYMSEEFEGWNSETREFRAKLSQIVFALEPRLELSGMVASTAGNSGHMKANKRIVEIAKECVKRNKENIPTYSENKTDFSQIHLMTNEQIKDCYRLVDPLNK